MHPTTLFLPLLSRQHRYPTAIPTLQHPPAKPGHSPPHCPWATQPTPFRSHGHGSG
ncbi:hypothetical protein L873DRAFT_1820050, partial [Choiromyces venosus 120613-1]